MAPIALQLPFEPGFLESAGQIAVIAGTFVLLLILVGYGGVAYKHLRGDGIRWPDDEPEDDDGLRRADDDDEWKYY